MITGVAITAVIAGARFAACRQCQMTLRTALEKGVDPSTLPLRGMPLRRRFLIGGTIWSVAGLLVGVAMQMIVAEQNAPHFVAALGWIPLAVGVALLALSRAMPTE